MSYRRKSFVYKAWILNWSHGRSVKFGVAKIWNQCFNITKFVKFTISQQSPVKIFVKHFVTTCRCYKLIFILNLIFFNTLSAGCETFPENRNVLQKSVLFPNAIRRLVVNLENAIKSICILFIVILFLICNARHRFPNQVDLQISSSRKWNLSENENNYKVSNPISFILNFQYCYSFVGDRSSYSICPSSRWSTTYGFWN